ncbi:hypothetical protein C8R43DRAFT_1137993 [Mycena crocata]|nr:hypothetical protein C8R43DRAFT_1137993 [Mycena crocata]
MGQTPSHPPATDTESKPESESDGSSPSPLSRSKVPAAGQPSNVAPASEVTVPPDSSSSSPPPDLKINPNESLLALSKNLNASLARALAVQLDINAGRIWGGLGGHKEALGVSPSVSAFHLHLPLQLFLFYFYFPHASNLHDSIRRRSLEDDDDDLGASPSSSSSSSADSHTENDDSHAVEDLHDQDKPGGGTS